MAEQEWLTVEQVAERYHIPRKTLLDWRYRNLGPTGVRIGRRVLYRQDALERWEAEQELADPRASA